MEALNKITATRNGYTRQFTARQWEAMGTGHCGWEIVPQVPKEVAHVVKAEGPGITAAATEIVPVKKTRKPRRK